MRKNAKKFLFPYAYAVFVFTIIYIACNVFKSACTIYRDATWCKYHEQKKK